MNSLYHMRMVWRAIGGVEEGTIGGGLRLLEAACATALHYADLVHGALADQGYYENNGEYRKKVVRFICINNLLSTIIYIYIYYLIDIVRL